MPDIIEEGTGHPAFRLKYKGIFDFDKLSSMTIKWFLDRKYEILEKKHKHKMSCPHGYEIEWIIQAERKIDDYYMYKLEAFFHLYDAYEVEAIKDGKKVKLWNARIEVQLSFDVVMDYADRWGRSPFFERFRNFYNQHMIKRYIISTHADPLYYKLMSLHTKMKEVLEMETPTVYELD